jgi:hypothetical protein
MTSTSRQGAEPILLAFSGGLDTSFCVPWLKDTYQRPVITVTVDTGGIDAAAAQSLAERSVQLGAVEHHLIDARAAYFEQVLKYLLMGNVRRGGVYPLCVGAERPPATIKCDSKWRCVPWRRTSRSSRRCATARSSGRNNSSILKIIACRFHRSAQPTP